MNENRVKGWTANGAAYNFDPQKFVQWVESEVWEAARIGLDEKFDQFAPVYEKLGMKWPDWILQEKLFHTLSKKEQSRLREKNKKQVKEMIDYYKKKR